MFRATVAPAWDLDAWRAQARHAWEAGLPPDVVEWQADAQRELLASAAVTDQPARRQGLSVPADFMAFAASVLCHRDPGRHALPMPTCIARRAGHRPSVAIRTR